MYGLFQAIAIANFWNKQKMFIKEKKDNSPILELHLVTLSRKDLNVKEKLYMKVLKKDNIYNQDIIRMLELINYIIVVI